MTLYLGVDPGLTGAIAIIGHDGYLVDVLDMPVVDGQVSASLLAEQFVMWTDSDCVVAVERVASRPGQGVASSFKFGASYGITIGVVGTLGYRSLHPTPTTWKKAMGLNADKDRSRKAAIDRWPSRAQWFARKKDDGRAEAALLALWCREQARVMEGAK